MKKNPSLIAFFFSFCVFFSILSSSALSMTPEDEKRLFQELAEIKSVLKSHDEKLAEMNSNIKSLDARVREVEKRTASIEGRLEVTQYWLIGLGGLLFINIFLIVLGSIMGRRETKEMMMYMSRRRPPLEDELEFLKHRVEKLEGLVKGEKP